MQNVVFRLVLVIGVYGALAASQCTPTELSNFATCVKNRTPNLKPAHVVDYFQSNLTACFTANGCAVPNFQGNGYQDAPSGFQNYANAMQNWFNDDLSPTQQSCISSQMMTTMQNEQNLGNCIPQDLQAFLTQQHTLIWNKGSNNKNQFQSQLVAASNARIAANSCGNPSAVDQCIMAYKKTYYTAVGCAIRSKCMQKKLSPACSAHITQELPSACSCLQQKKQQVANDADSDSVSAAQKYYNLRKTDLNNAAQACGINPSTMPQLTDYFKNECPQVNLVGNTFSNSLGGIFSSSSVLGQAVNSQVSQVNALPEYGCIGVIAKSNQPKFNEMSSRIQAITNDEPAFCNCQ